ncbi:hypothetical protein VaNZ11_006580 [Volvox africanus]|uniref:Uncharacterized protein n=1 Tax=Volvox africanus TaxID=51714 RepID=A0ABQ5S257_9CHLO|nr:hypothetical protein VaNZ11_006580 [Volvox africanus]
MKDIVAIPAVVAHPMAVQSNGTYGMKSAGALSKLRRRIPNPPVHLIHGGPSDANLMVATTTSYSMQYDEQIQHAPRLGCNLNGRVRGEPNGAARHWCGPLDLGSGSGSGSGPEVASTSPLPPPLRSCHPIGVNVMDCHPREASAAMAASVAAAAAAAAVVAAKVTSEVYGMASDSGADRSRRESSSTTMNINGKRLAGCLTEPEGDRVADADVVRAAVRRRNSSHVDGKAAVAPRPAAGTTGNPPHPSPPLATAAATGAGAITTPTAPVAPAMPSSGTTAEVMAALSAIDQELLNVCSTLDNRNSAERSDILSGVLRRAIAPGRPNGAVGHDLGGSHHCTRVEVGDGSLGAGSSAYSSGGSDGAGGNNSGGDTSSGGIGFSERHTGNGHPNYPQPNHPHHLHHLQKRQPEQQPPTAGFIQLQLGCVDALTAIGEELLGRLVRVQRAKANLNVMELLIRQEISFVHGTLADALQRSPLAAALPPPSQHSPRETPQQQLQATPPPLQMCEHIPGDVQQRFMQQLTPAAPPPSQQQQQITRQYQQRCTPPLTQPPLTQPPPKLPLPAEEYKQPLHPQQRFHTPPPQRHLQQQQQHYSQQRPVPRPLPSVPLPPPQQQQRFQSSPPPPPQLPQQQQQQHMYVQMLPVGAQRGPENTGGLKGTQHSAHCRTVPTSAPPTPAAVSIVAEQPLRMTFGGGAGRRPPHRHTLVAEEPRGLVTCGATAASRQQRPSSIPPLRLWQPQPQPQPSAEPPAPTTLPSAIELRTTKLQMLNQ